MRKQSRQQLKFQALLAERAHFMRHNMTETESQLWRQLARCCRANSRQFVQAWISIEQLERRRDRMRRF